MKKLLFFLISFGIFSCSNDDNAETNNLIEEAGINFSFNHTWGSGKVTSSDFNTVKFTNEYGTNISISKLRYLISNIKLENDMGELVAIEGYSLIDLTNNENLTFSPATKIPVDTYTKIHFVFGFTKEENIDGAYTDLNSASWNWPEMLGGGYHFMQFEGMFVNNSSEEQGYAYHNGTARKSEGVFEQNYTTYTFDLNNFNIPSSNGDGDISILISMDISEWFKNPNLWNLNELNSALMPNYDAQIMMHQNAASVFKMENISFVQ